jgi:ABC-type multidrug transport system fused ATPase/permease subunit
MLSLAFRFRGFARPYALRLTLGVAVLAISVVADLAQPWPLKVVVDSVLNNHPFPSWVPDFVANGSNDTQIAVLSLGLLAIVAVGGVLAYLGTYWSQSVGQQIVFDIREVVHTHLHRLSLAYHHQQRPGDLANRLTGDIDRILTVVISLVVNVATNALTLVGMLAIMFYVNWQFTLLAIAITPVLFLTIYKYTNRIKFSSRHARKQEGRVAALVQESLSAIHVVQAYTREEYEFERFRQEAAGSLKSSMEATALQARFSPLVDFLSAVSTVVVLWVGAHAVMNGRLTLGLMLVFISYLKGFYSPMKQLSKLSYVISRGTASAERLNEVLDAAPQLPESADPYFPDEVRGAVTFEGVSFRYPLGEDAALRDVGFSVQPGEVVALVGPTGAGKSTILSLVPRFYDVASGAVTVDGVDVREWDLRTLRDNVSLVLQDTWIFQASILENILYGRPGATWEEAVNAARAANAEEFIERLPDGYETVVGPRGATLSGGQRQRIAIARAMLRAAPILILDEPITGLDPESAHVVLQALGRLMEGRTTIVIAHGEAPLVLADEVLVVEGGRIVESGSFDELRLHGPRYRRLQRIAGDAALEKPEAKTHLLAEPTAPAPPEPRAASNGHSDGHRFANGNVRSYWHRGAAAEPRRKGKRGAVAAIAAAINRARRGL